MRSKEDCGDRVALGTRACRPVEYLIPGLGDKRVWEDSFKTRILWMIDQSRSLSLTRELELEESCGWLDFPSLWNVSFALFLFTRTQGNTSTLADTQQHIFLTHTFETNFQATQENEKSCQGSEV